MNRKERRIAEKQGTKAPALTEVLNRTIALQQAGQLQAATTLCQQMLAISPQNSDILALLGTLHLQQGNSEACIMSLDRAIAINTSNATAYIHRGIAHYNLKAYEKSLADYDKAITLSPRTADAYNNRGFTLFTLERYKEAVVSYDKALSINPHFCEALVNKGDALGKLEHYAEAVSAYDKAIAANSRFVQAYNNRANALAELGKYEEALASCDQGIALNPTIADQYNTRAAILKSMNRVEESIASTGKALAINPQYLDALINQGAALHRLGQYRAAIENYDKALHINPESAESLYNKSHSLLVLGEYDEAWSLYESRFQTPKLAREISNTTKTAGKQKWRGNESLAGKRILLYHEQGLGDTIQFCRYALMVEALGAKAIVEVPASLVTVLSTLPMQGQVLPQTDAPVEFDYHCALMSLPLAFKTRANTIPANVPYIFADSEKTRIWQQKLGAKTRKRIGLIWSGGTVHKNDRNRSIALNTLLPLLECDAQFHCLQKEIRPNDVHTLAHTAIISHTEELQDFSDTAALIMEMDLVISVDTSVAHLAGALGKPVWILLPFVPDFRWLLEREDSPWYPTARLFRQKQLGDWASVIELLKQNMLDHLC